MNKLLKIAFVLGLILLSQKISRGAVVPFRYVVWDVNPYCLDVLESGGTPNGPWADVAGPYVAKVIAGVYCYQVPRTVILPAEFFRVRRIWGSPWILLLETAPAHISDAAGLQCSSPDRQAGESPFQHSRGIGHSTTANQNRCSKSTLHSH